jgi:hypothetical protein
MPFKRFIPSSNTAFKSWESYEPGRKDCKSFVVMHVKLDYLMF